MLVLEKVSIGTIGYRDQYKKKKIDTFDICSTNFSTPTARKTEAAVPSFSFFNGSIFQIRRFGFVAKLSDSCRGNLSPPILNSGEIISRR